MVGNSWLSHLINKMKILDKRSILSELVNCCQNENTNICINTLTL